MEELHPAFPNSTKVVQNEMMLNRSLPYMLKVKVSLGLCRASCFIEFNAQKGPFMAIYSDHKETYLPYHESSC